MQLRIDHVSYTYPSTNHAVLRDLSVAFPEGWTGLLGDNGCGKTTLAKIACGLLSPDAGAVTRGLFSVYCAQEVDMPPEGLLDFAGDWGQEARELRRAFQLEDDMPWRFDGLSCGERKKLQVAVALWQRPDVLVLDEPTNHIDHAARVQLAGILGRFRGIGILVSHDRELLDALVERCVSFEPGGVAVRPGGYTVAHGQAALERDTAVRERRRAKAELVRLAAEKDKRSRTAARADARNSKRRIDPKDHDAKGRIDLARVSGQDGVRGRLSAQMDARVDAARERVARAFVSKRYDGSLWTDAEASPRKMLLHAEACAVPCGAGELVLPELYVGNTDHIGIVGPNGAGKSTLLAHLRTQYPDDLPILDIPQELGSDQREKVIGCLSGLSEEERGRVLSVVAQLNSDPARILEGGSTSPGELRKLMLAIGLLQEPVLIVMDEPTNHLDLHSTQALERVLATYPGALVLVSHDHVFLHACTSVLWEVRDGEVRVR